MLTHELQESQFETQAALDKAIKLERQLADKETRNSRREHSRESEKAANRQDAAQMMLSGAAMPQTSQSLIFLQRENEALKDRVKEVRLILNKQVNDLKEELASTKLANETEVTRLKIQYGKDLNALNKRHTDLIDSINEKAERDATQKFNDLKAEHDKTLLAQKTEHFDAISQIKGQLAEETILKERFYIDLQKLKGNANNIYEGGYGTFSLAFENPFYVQLIEKQTQLQ